MPGAVLLYSDLNCPFCYALEARLAPLVAELGVALEWRGVEHAPWLPSPTRAAAPALAAELDREAEALARLAPELPLRRPAGKPNTRAAILATAGAIERDPERGRRFKASLYRAFWHDGLDIGDPAVLDELAACAGVERCEPTVELEARFVAWRLGWERTGIGAVPLLVTASGRVLPGLVATRELREFMRASLTTRGA